jgi:hypothetical protein
MDLSLLLLLLVVVLACFLFWSLWRSALAFTFGACFGLLLFFFWSIMGLL